MNIREHDTWVVSPRLYAALHHATAENFNLPCTIDRFGIKILPVKYMAETQLALMKDGQLVQVIEVEWV